MALTREGAGFTVLQNELSAVAVMLDLMNPGLPIGRLVMTRPAKRVPSGFCP
jgi:hypothetical protein